MTLIIGFYNNSFNQSHRRKLHLHVVVFSTKTATQRVIGSSILSVLISFAYYKS